jgi:hypothetical protein
LHGRSAIAVITAVDLDPVDLSKVTTMAITVSVVMAAPVVADGSLGTRYAIAARSPHRPWAACSAASWAVWRWR